MKKINNKGMTMIELLISIALISLVMLFLYSLLNEISYEKDNDFIANKNQDLRAEIIDKIYSNIINGVSSYALVNNTLTINDNLIISKESDTKLNVYGQTFTLKQGNFGDFACNKQSYINDDIMVECSIKVYTNNTNNHLSVIDNKTVDNNNTLDDIIFSFIKRS